MVTTTNGSVAAPGSPQASSAATSQLHGQEIPNDAEAVKRAVASLKSWEEHVSAVVSDNGRQRLDKHDLSTSLENRPCLSCKCIQKVLPEVLRLDFCLNPNQKANQQALWFQNPVHALHFGSQGLTDLPKQTHQQATLPVLYGDEDERRRAMTLPGVPDVWHALQSSDYCLARPAPVTPSKRKPSSPKKSSASPKDNKDTTTKSKDKEKKTAVAKSLFASKKKPADSAAKPSPKASMTKKTELTPKKEGEESSTVSPKTGPTATATTEEPKKEESTLTTQGAAEPPQVDKDKEANLVPQETTVPPPIASDTQKQEEPKEAAADKMEIDESDQPKKNETGEISDKQQESKDGKEKMEVEPVTESNNAQPAKPPPSSLPPKDGLAPGASTSVEPRAETEAKSNAKPEDPPKTPLQTAPAAAAPAAPVTTEKQDVKRNNPDTVDRMEIDSQPKEPEVSTKTEPSKSKPGEEASQNETSSKDSKNENAKPEETKGKDSADPTTSLEPTASKPDPKPKESDKVEEKESLPPSSTKEANPTTSTAKTNNNPPPSAIPKEASNTVATDKAIPDKTKDSESTQPKAEVVTTKSEPKPKTSTTASKSTPVSDTKKPKDGAANDTNSAAKQNLYLLPDSVFRQYHLKEENMRQVRKAMFGKRQAALLSSPTAKNGNSAGTSGTSSKAGKDSGPEKKKRKVEKIAHLEQLLTYQPPTIAKCGGSNIAGRQKREQEKAERQALRWMTHYRMSARESENQKYRSSRPSNNNNNNSRFSKSFVFGAFEDDEEDLREEQPETTEKDSDLLYCLDCGFVGGRHDMRRHTVLTTHSLGVTLKSGDRGTARQLYCYNCDGFFQHPLFLQEEERQLLSKILPSMAWQIDEKRHTIRRSFDPLNFMQVPDLGIFWDGFRATYPAPVPRYHVLAARICRLRYQLVHGGLDVMLQAFERKYGTGNNSTTRNKDLLRQLLSIVKSPIARPVGMFNLGNTCFQSSVFQCLVHCEPLQRHFLHDIGHASGACHLYQNEHQPPKGVKGVCLACEMDTLFLHYQSRSSGIDMVRAMKEISENAESSAIESLESDPISVLYAKSAEDGCIIHPSSQGEPMVAQKDLLAATWKCKEMSHLAGYAEHDAHEFLHAFLEALGKHGQDFQRRISHTLRDKVPPTIEPKIPNVIQDLFEGSLRSVLLCQECGAKRVQKESFLSVSLDLSKEVQQRTSTSTHFSPPRTASSDGTKVASSPLSGMETRKLSVEKCLRHFTSPEQLLDPVHCPHCEKKTRTKKQHVFSRLPPVLCLHLKRFHGLQKMEDFVSFPAHDMNMGEYLPHWCEDSGFLPEEVNSTNDGNFAPPPDVCYDLFGSVNHFGNLHNGHYVSNVKIGDLWFHCNDAHVSFTREADVLSSNAYLLFYVRSDVVL